MIAIPTTPAWMAAIRADEACRKAGICLFTDTDGCLAAFPGHKMTQALATIVKVNSAALHYLLDMRAGIKRR